MTDKEKQDLEALQKESDGIRRAAFLGMRHSLGMAQEDLKNSGYKTTEDAVVATFKFAQTKLDKLIKDHLKKYPD